MTVDERLELPERFPQKYYVQYVSPIPRSQSSQIPACMRNHMSEIACFLALLFVWDLHSFFVSLKAVLIEMTAFMTFLDRQV